MINQPPSDGSHMPRQMVSRVEQRGLAKQSPRDKALCAKARGDALKKQREALGAPVAEKNGVSHSSREKAS
jgi:hypothetical protein